MNKRGLAQKTLLFGGMTAALILLIFLAAGVGSSWLSPREIAEGLWYGDRKTQVIILNLRLPRILIALLTGAALAVSGALLQAVMRNPLADPGIIGVSAGAAAAATSVLLLFPFLLKSLPLAAFAGAIFACGLIYLMAWQRGIDPLRIVLSGVAINTVLGAYTSFLQLLNADNLVSVLGFLNGSLSGRNWEHVETVTIYVGIGLVLAFACSKGADILQLGDEMATGLGVNANRIRLLLSGVGAFLAAATVSVAGLIGFVGLVDMARMMGGSGHRTLLPLSALLGAFTLLLADTVGRILVTGMEIPVGVIMAVTGGPFFLYMLRRSRNGGI